MKLPQSNIDFVFEGVAMKGDEEKGEYEHNVNVGIPFSKVPLGCCQNLDALVYKIDESEEYQEEPSNPGYPNF